MSKVLEIFFLINKYNNFRSIKTYEILEIKLNILQYCLKLKLLVY